VSPSFRFRLERVRAVRERKEKLAQRELADALSRRSSSVSELRSAEDRVEHAQEQQRTAPAVLSGGDLLARQAFLERTEAQRRMSERELQQREAEVAARDAELTTAAGEHEMLNRLRDRRRGEHEREVARRESGVLDEIAASRFSRSQA
jgi:flagellar export protein FliJ